MLARLASRVMTWSAVATALMLVVVAVYLALFALSGGLPTVLATDAPPDWALTQFAVLAVIVGLYLLAAVVLTVSLALVQLKIGPGWTVVAGLLALAVGAGLLVTGSRIDALAYVGFAVYMVAANVVGLRARQLNGVTAGVGLASALLLLAAMVAGGGAGTGISLALAITLYGAWAACLGISEWRHPASGRTRQAPLQAVLQTDPGDR